METFNDIRYILSFIVKFGIAVVAFIIELTYVYEWFGIIGVILGVFLFPGTMALVPIIVIFTHGEWLLFILTICYVFIPFIMIIGIDTDM